MFEKNLLKSNIYINDIHNVLSQYKDFNKFKNKSFFITGCNGLICSSIVDLLIELNQTEKLNISLYLATRNIEKTKNRFIKYNNNSIHFIEYDANEPLKFDKQVDYYIHGASPASPDLFVSNPVDTIMSNIFGLKEILESSRNYKSRTLYISSSEIYGKVETSEPITETACGPIEILNPRTSYGQSKRAAENLCVSYISQYNSDVVIVRPGHIYGPTASIMDKRVSSLFMYNALNGLDIILKSKGESIRSYTYCLDCASAILMVLLYGNTGEAYNISNPNSICSIKDMAQYFADTANVKLKFEIPDADEKKAFNPMNNSSLNSSKLESLGWKPTFEKKEGFEHSIKILKELA